MNYMPPVVAAEHVSEYTLRLRFDDGTEGIVDFKRWLIGPVFEPLKEAEFFVGFFLDGGTVTWPNGADIAPETLYAEAKSSESAA